MIADTNASPTSESSPTAGTRAVRFKILRQDKPDGRAYWQEFDVPVEPGANIISCLQWIAANPRTVTGEDVPPIAYDAGCLEEVCGSCTMNINGHVRQACSALIDELAPSEGDVITLEPMHKFPTVRDLFVDRERMFHFLRRTKSWVPIDGTWDLGPGPKSTPQEQQVRYHLSECMTCGCCLEACPQFHLESAPANWDDSFLGAQIISQVRLFNMHETGAVLKDDRLDVMAGFAGVNDCGNAQNCVKVCPKDIPLTESIAAIGRATTIHSLKRYFSGR